MFLKKKKKSKGKKKRIKKETLIKGATIGFNLYKAYKRVNR